MMESTPLPAKRQMFALFAILACCIMFFIEYNGISFLTMPAIMVAFVITGLYLYAFLKYSRRVILSSFFQVYYMVGLLVSAAVISGGAHMVEVSATGDANGSFWLILAFFIGGMETTYLGFQSRLLSNIAKKTPGQSWETTSQLILVTSGVVIGLAAFTFISVGSPLLIGVDRVTFWRLLAPTYLSFFPSLVAQTYFFVAYYFLIKKKKTNTSPIPLAITLSYALIIIFILGEKFTAFVIAANAWLMVVAGVFPQFKVKTSHVVTSAILIGLIILFIAFSYILSGREAEFIFARVALQAQLIWSVLSDPYSFRMLPSSDWQCLFSCGWYDNGKDLISHQYLPQGLYRFYYEGGTELSGFMPALPILTLGLLAALFLHFAICFVLGALQREVISAVSKEDFVASFLLYKVQLGCTVIWFAAMVSAVAGTIAAAVLLALYLIVLGRRGRPPQPPAFTKI